MDVRFIDTSILLNLLGVPGKCQERDAVREEFRQTVESKESLILPLAAIIETGNHIAHIADGRKRRTISDKFCEYLRHTANETAPWVFYQKGWDKDALIYFAENFQEYAVNEISLGDMSIIHSYEQFINETPSVSSIMIWSTDNHLSAYRQTGSLYVRRR